MPRMPVNVGLEYGAKARQASCNAQGQQLLLLLLLCGPACSPPCLALALTNGLKVALWSARAAAVPG
jgi:hypothetical protein